MRLKYNNGLCEPERDGIVGYLGFRVVNDGRSGNTLTVATCYKNSAKCRWFKEDHSDREVFFEELTKITLYGMRFSYTDDYLVIDGVNYKVEDSYEWTVKILKTKIKAIGGAKGLFAFIVESYHSDSPWNHSRDLIERIKRIKQI